MFRISTTANPVVFQVKNSLDPNSWIRALRTWRNWTISSVFIVQCIRPTSFVKVSVSKLSASQSAVVQKSFLLHHGKLGVTSTLKIRGSGSQDGSVVQVGISAHHFLHVAQFSSPALYVQGFPIGSVILMSEKNMSRIPLLYIKFING